MIISKKNTYLRRKFNNINIMIKLFYQDKVILFTTKNNGYSEKDAIFEDRPVVSQLICFMEQTKELSVVSENEQSAFSYFCRDFIPVTAAGGVVSDSISGNILMIFRNGRWDLPKGKLEVGESIEECAVREVMEETGIDGIKTVGEPFITKHIYNTYGHWELKTTYWYSMNYDESEDKREHKNFVPQAIEGITRCEWLSRTKIALLIHGSYAAIKEVLKNSFEEII